MQLFLNPYRAIAPSFGALTPDDIRVKTDLVILNAIKQGKFTLVNASAHNTKGGVSVVTGQLQIPPGNAAAFTFEFSRKASHVEGAFGLGPTRTLALVSPKGIKRGFIADIRDNKELKPLPNASVPELKPGKAAQLKESIEKALIALEKTFEEMKLL